MASALAQRLAITGLAVSATADVSTAAPIVGNGPRRAVRAVSE
jgi:hypothetical protein